MRSPALAFTPLERRIAGGIRFDSAYIGGYRRHPAAASTPRVLADALCAAPARGKET
jgi:hypothetical protein